MATGEILSKDSQLFQSSQLALWEVPQTQVAIQQTELVSFNPVTAISGDGRGPFEFDVHTDHQLLDVSSNLLYMTCSVRNADGTPLAWAANDRKVAVINNIGQTFIKQITATLNGREIYNSGPCYMYEAFVSNCLSFEEKAKEEALSVEGYVREGEPDGGDLDSRDTPAFQKKASTIKQSTVLEYAVPIRGGIFSQPKPLLPYSTLHITITRNPDPFCLLSYEQQRASDYILRVHKVEFRCKKLEVQPGLLGAMEQQLVRMNALYPIRRVQTKIVALPAGTTTIPTSPQFQGQLPRRITICFVESDAFHGQYNKNPFFFKPHNLRQLALMVNGQKVPATGLKMDYTRNAFRMAFSYTRDSLGLRSNPDRTVDLTDTMFKTYKNFYAFDLSQSNAADFSNWEMLRKGSVWVDGYFGTPAPAQGLHMLLLAEYDNVIQVGKTRDVVMDFAL